MQLSLAPVFYRLSLHSASSFFANTVCAKCLAYHKTVRGGQRSDTIRGQMAINYRGGAR